MESFRRLGIIEPILRAIREQNFEKPTQIQEKSIPLLLSGRDLIGGSATGSGKTLAFGSRIIQTSEKGRGTQALVLTPTRELAQQVSKALRKFSKYKPLEIVEIHGGVAINPQIQKLKTADVVVGTPGRILDHLRRQTLHLDKVKTLVLDEADRMLDMGFIPDVEKIIRETPKQRQNLLFSATISRRVLTLGRQILKNPAKVSVEHYVDPSKLSQVYYEVPRNLKLALLAHLLKKEKEGLVMVFCNTRRSTDYVARNLNLAGINANAIHGGFTQEKRDRTMKRFHSQNVQVMVCTDVAARGLDISGVSHVYNYDIPEKTKPYVHRIGRTARAGKKGKAISIVSDAQRREFRSIQITSEVQIKKLKTPELKPLPTQKNQQGGRKRPRRDNWSRERQRNSFNRRRRSSWTPR